MLTARAIVLSCSLLPLIALSAQATTTLYVDNSSTNDCAHADGSSAKPFCSIAAAMPYAGPDTIIAIKPGIGVYREEVHVYPGLGGSSIDHPALIMDIGRAHV